MGDMMHDTAEQEEKIILVGVATAENDDKIGRAHV